jgi:uncharacterized protein (TIGR03089 family)
VAEHPGEPTPESLFAARLAADPSGPLVTFYDDASGERAELSAKSMGNWVAKTHFLLIDELALAPGARAFVSLPVHWLAVPVLFGCWFAGIEVISTPTGADVAFGDVDALLEAAPELAAVDDRFAVSLLSMARSGQPPAPLTDYAAAVRPQPDAWATVRAQTGAATPALDGLTRVEVARAAADRATELGLTAGGRLLWSEPDFGPQQWLSAILAPLAVGGSTVLLRHPDPSRTPAVAEAERVTVSC